MENTSLDVLFEDKDIIAINKPSGLLTHPSWLTKKGTENLATLVKDYLNGDKVYTVHRLDRATSGVILIAKNKEAAQRLAESFRLNQVQKKYLCVVRGFAPDVGTIDHPLLYKHDKKAEPFAKGTNEPQIACTDFKRMAKVELPISVGKWPAARYSLVEAMPKTGRKHQLRRHFKHILCPIVGDTNYGEGRHNKLFREHYSINRLLLMATEIDFIHPISNQQLVIKAPLSVEVKDLFVQFGWEQYC